MTLDAAQSASIFPLPPKQSMKRSVGKSHQRDGATGITHNALFMFRNNQPSVVPKRLRNSATLSNTFFNNDDNKNNKNNNSTSPANGVNKAIHRKAEV